MANIRQLRAFQAVMITGTQTRAAQKLRLTQPAISSLIQSLEEELGFKLFERVKGRLIPSKEASYFYDYVSGVLASLSNLDQVAKDIRESNTGALQIAANPSMSLAFLPGVIAKFQTQHPAVNVVLLTRSSAKVIEMLGTQQFDIGFAEPPINSALIEAEKIRLRCVCVLPEGHKLAQRAVIRPQDLDGQRLVSIHREHISSARLAELCAQAHAVPRVKIEAQLFWTACRFVMEGAGVAIVDPLTAREFQGRGIAICPFEPAVYAEMGIIFPVNRPKSLPTLKFSQFVRRKLAEAQAAMGSLPV